jgi:hypothetical protein
MKTETIIWATGRQHIIGNRIMLLPLSCGTRNDDFDFQVKALDMLTGLSGPSLYAHDDIYCLDTLYVALMWGMNMSAGYLVDCFAHTLPKEALTMPHRWICRFLCMCASHPDVVDTIRVKLLYVNLFGGEQIEYQETYETTMDTILKILFGEYIAVTNSIVQDNCEPETFENVIKYTRYVMNLDEDGLDPEPIAD